MAKRELPAGARFITPTQMRKRAGDRSKTWFWSTVRRDPDFPTLFYLTAREPVAFEHDFDAWMERKADQSRAEHQGPETDVG